MVRPPEIFASGFRYLTSGESTDWIRRNELGWVGFKDFAAFEKFWFRVKSLTFNSDTFTNITYWYEAEWDGTQYVQTGGVYAAETAAIGEITITRKEPYDADGRPISSTFGFPVEDGFTEEAFYNYDYTARAFQSGEAWSGTSRESKLIQGNLAVWAGSKVNAEAGSHPIATNAVAAGLALGTGSFIFKDEGFFQISFKQPVIDTDGSVWVPLSLYINQSIALTDPMPTGYVNPATEGYDTYKGDTVQIYNGGGVTDVFAQSDGIYLGGDYLSAFAYAGVSTAALFAYYDFSASFIDAKMMPISSDIAEYFVSGTEFLIAVYGWYVDDPSPPARWDALEFECGQPAEDGFLAWGGTWNEDTGAPS